MLCENQCVCMPALLSHSTTCSLCTLEQSIDCYRQDGPGNSVNKCSMKGTCTSAVNCKSLLKWPWTRECNITSYYVTYFCTSAWEKKAAPLQCCSHTKSEQVYCQSLTYFRMTVTKGLRNDRINYVCGCISFPIRIKCVIHTHAWCSAYHYLLLHQCRPASKSHAISFRISTASSDNPLQVHPPTSQGHCQMWHHEANSHNTYMHHWLVKG